MKEKILIKPISTEKAVRAIELENKITFVVALQTNKTQIKEEIEKMFNVKVESINTNIIKNEKVAFIKLKKENSALDVATKLGLI